MAEAAKKKEEAGAQPKAKKGSKLPWILVAVGVLAAGGGGAWFALRPKHADNSTSTDASQPAATPATAPRAAPIYYKFDPAFVVNFGGEGSARYFQVTVEAMSRNQAVLDVLKNNEPAVRNDLVLLYSSQDSATLLSVEGKEKLRAATLAAIRKVLDEEGADGKLVEQVYFTSFVIQ
ncbi:MAG TPA: flagellar basal body-associated FliL family protein [Steroidobacteraceae bacterium]|jgi:flagellar FliL protein|nr:flagellar basal body-associated FliL family protein [Steroidobacteraceae bacterium]